MQLYQLYDRAKQESMAICEYLLEKSKELWKRTEPTRARITQTSIALYTSFSAFKSTIEMIPFITSGLAIMATVLPAASFFNSSIMFLVLGTFFAVVSGLVGLFKYYDLKLKNEQEKQVAEHEKKMPVVEEHEKQIAILTCKYAKNKSKVKELKRNVEQLKAAILPPCNNGSVLRYSLRNTPARQNRAQSVTTGTIPKRHSQQKRVQ